MNLAMLSRATAALLVALGCSCSPLYGAAAANEIIVKFTTSHTINAQIVQAFDDPDAELSLREFTRELSSEVGIPFQYSRLTSGREIVIEVTWARIVEMIADRIRNSAGVEEVIVIQRTRDSAGYSPDEIQVTLDHARLGAEPPARANSLAAQLVDDDRYPVSGGFLADGRLAVSLDLEQLVQTLARNLTDRADIEYAQPNYRVRHFDVMD